jgi:drug/metabolite transporter (DMT)-like permease
MPLAHALLFAAALIWGWSFVASKLALAQLAPHELLALRMLTGLPIVILLWALRRPQWGVDRAMLRPALFGAAIFATHFMVQITGMVYTSATNTGWLITAVPLVLALLAWGFAREWIAGRTWLGIGVASFGAVLLISRGQLTNLSWLQSVGDWLVLTSCFTWACYTLATRDLARAADPLIVTLLMLGPTALFSVVWTLLVSDLQRFATLDATTWLAVLFLGPIATGLAQWFWQLGVARLGAARAGLYLYLEPLATTAIAGPLLGEQLGWVAAVGGLLVLGGVWLGQPRFTESRDAVS